MAITADWYAKNSVRSFPFSLQASLIDNAGKHLPADVLADLKVRFPGSHDSELFVSSFTLTDSMVSLTLSRTRPDITTVASVVVARRDLDLFTPVPLVANNDQDVTGLVVFGDLDNIANGTWGFQSAAQSGIEQTAFVISREPAFNRFGFIGQQSDIYPLTVVGQGDIAISEEELVLDGQLRNAIVFSLVDNVELEDRSVLNVYAGACGQRPESRTCSDPQPIESINGVVADCCGRVFIEFRGCGDLLPLENHCGVVLDCQTSVEDTCPASTQVPGPDGRLPNEFPDQCDNTGPQVSEQDEAIRELVDNPPTNTRTNYRMFL